MSEYKFVTKEEIQKAFDADDPVDSMAVVAEKLLAERDAYREVAIRERTLEGTITAALEASKTVDIDASEILALSTTGRAGE